MMSECNTIAERLRIIAGDATEADRAFLDDLAERIEGLPFVFGHIASLERDKQELVQSCLKHAYNINRPPPAG